MAARLSPSVINANPPPEVVTIPRAPGLKPAKVLGCDFAYIRRDELRRLIQADRRIRGDGPAPEPGEVTDLVGRLETMAEHYRALTGDAFLGALALAREIPHLLLTVRDLVRRSSTAEQRAEELQTDLNEAVDRLERVVAETGVPTVEK